MNRRAIFLLIVLGALVGFSTTAEPAAAFQKGMGVCVGAAAALFIDWICELAGW